MREIRLSGLEGGVGRKPYPYPYPVLRERRPCLRNGCTFRFDRRGSAELDLADQIGDAGDVVAVEVGVDALHDLYSGRRGRR